MGNKHAILVDDDKRWFSVCRLMCAAFKYDCTWAPNLTEAQAQLTDRTYDVLILDLGFPDRAGDLFPGGVDELDVFLAGLMVNSPLPVLVCTGSTDKTKVALVSARLGASGRSCHVYRKGDDVHELYRAFGSVTGKPPARDASKPGGLGPILLALATLVVLHLVLLFSLLVARLYLPEDSGRGLMYFVMALIAFTGSASTLLLFWGLRAVTKRDVTRLLEVAFASFFQSPQPPQPPAGGLRTPQTKKEISS